MSELIHYTTASHTLRHSLSYFSSSHHNIFLYCIHMHDVQYNLGHDAPIKSSIKGLCFYCLTLFVVFHVAK